MKTDKQKKIIDKFQEKYFQISLETDKISMGDFMGKNDIEKDDFVKTWTQERYDNMITLEASLNAQLGRVAIEKQLAKDALKDWGIII